MRADTVWPPVGYCETCQGRTRWFEATVGRKTDLICENCGRVSPREARARKDGGLCYEGYCKSCAATTLWAIRKAGLFDRGDSLFCCNCGHDAYPVFDRRETEVFVAMCTNCGGDTLWHEDSLRDEVCCLSCSRKEPITFKRWLERAPAGSRAQSGDETRAYR
jgi:hypothetical protein